MRSLRTIHVVSAHAEGEVGDVIVGGVAPPPGETLAAQRDWIERDGALRDFVLNEPRGGVFRHVNLLVPPKRPEAAMGFIIMEPEDTPLMSGSNSICVATVLLDTGILPMTEPVTEFLLEAPGGLVAVRAECREGKARSITVRNMPSFVAARGEADWRHISFCLFAGPLAREGDALAAKAAVAIRPGKIDRSPTGTALSARMALLHAAGEMKAGERLIQRSVLGSEFHGRIARETEVAGRPAILPEITGRAWITGVHQHMLDPEDPWPRGYRLSDTWPGASSAGR